VRSKVSGITYSFCSPVQRRWPGTQLMISIRAYEYSLHRSLNFRFPPTPAPRSGGAITPPNESALGGLRPALTVAVGRLSSTIDADFFVAALEEGTALFGKPDFQHRSRQPVLFASLHQPAAASRAGPSFPRRSDDQDPHAGRWPGTAGPVALLRRAGKRLQISNRKKSFAFSPFLYRSQLDRALLRKIKHARGFTRYDKRANNFLAAIKLFSAHLWINANESAA
jgi:hypothetical protein